MTDKADHPTQVFHYTTTTGFKGIVTTQKLHASSILYLNDRKELRYVDTFIGEGVKRRLVELYSELRTKGIMNKPFDPDMLAEYESDVFISALHRVSSRLGPTFVCSFCRAADEYSANNGLLSQWRGYGADGGIAICFNVAKLTEIVKSETDRYHYVFGHFGDVIYGEADPEFKEIAADIPMFAKAVPEIIEATLEAGGISYRFSGERATLEDLHRPYSRVAPRLKHPGFTEEREYRIILAATRDSAEREGPKKRKEIQFRVRDNYLVPFIEIGDPNIRLPIEYVIVGPSRESTRRKESVELLLRENGYEVDVILSEIPFA